MPNSAVLIGTNNHPRGEGIYRCQLDLDTGELRDLDLVARVENPSFLVLTHNERNLYCVSEHKKDGEHTGGSVHAFSVSQGSAELSPISHRSTEGTCPVHLSVDREEKGLYVANYASGSVISYPLNSDGSIGAKASFFQLEGSSIHPKRQKQAHAHSIYIDPQSKKAYACDLGSDKVWIYDCDPSTARLSPSKPDHKASKAGSGPRHMAFHEGGKRLFVLNELSSNISVFDFSGLKNQLNLKQTISTLPDTFKDHSTCAEIVVSRDGKYIYASNRGHDSIAVFLWNEGAEKLELAGRAPTNGQHPRNFVIDSTEQYLLAANLRSDNVVSFFIDPDDGTLEPTGFSIEVPNPICVRCLSQ